jgi:hypothetical protein
MLGANWFWHKTSYKWIVSAQASCLFALASVFTCLLTTFWLGVFHPSKNMSGFLANLLWGIFGVLGPLSIIFLWTGMREFQKYREMRDVSLARKSKLAHIALSIGIWYGALFYYLLVYLPTRRRSFIREGFGTHVS